MDSVKLLGKYDEADVYYIKNKVGESLFFKNKYFMIPKFIEKPSEITLIQAVKIINNRLQWLETKKQIDELQNKK